MKTATFFPEYPNKDYDHEQYKHIVVRAMVQALNTFINEHGYDLRYDWTNDTYFVTQYDKTIAKDFNSRTDALYWMINHE